MLASPNVLNTVAFARLMYVLLAKVARVSEAFRAVVSACVSSTTTSMSPTEGSTTLDTLPPVRV